MIALVGMLACSASQDGFEFEERLIVDSSRPLEEFGAQPASDAREILLYTWSGSGEDVADRPLVLIAHGVDGHPDKFQTFATELTDRGYFVGAIAFPSTNRDALAGYAGLGDLPNQPGDLAATVDYLSAAVTDRSDSFYRRFDPETIGVIGHSLGAATVMGWTRFDCCRTDRADAVVLLSTPQTLGVVFGEGPDAIGPPTLLAHGLDDQTVTWEETQTFAAEIDELATVYLTGVGHSEAIEGGGDQPAREHFRTLVDGLFREQLLGEEGALSEVLADSMYVDDEVQVD